MNLSLQTVTRGAELLPEPFAPRLRRVVRRLDRRERLQVLLIEDDEADAYLIRRALAKNARVGEVLLAEDGVEALELLDRLQIQPDLALVDLRMPRKDGIAFLKEIAKRKAFDLPCVVLTSSKSKKDAIRAWKRGALAFVTKPKAATELETELGRVVARYA